MRRFMRIALLIGLVAAPAAWAQPIDAEITYYHRQKKKEDTVKGTVIEESPGQLAFYLVLRREGAATTRRR